MLEKELEDRMEFIEFIGLTKDLMLILWHTHSVSGFFGHSNFRVFSFLTQTHKKIEKTTHFGIPSGNLTFIVDFPIKNGDFP
jgi:hypothetical protein